MTPASLSMPASRQQRQESYTQQQPDGTVVTTTKTVRSKYVEDTEYGCGPGTLNERYCCKPVGIIRIVEIIVSLIIISLITSVFGPGPFKGVLFGQTFLMIFTGVALCLTFIFLIVFFFNLHQTHLFFWPWHVSDFIFSIVAAITFLILCFVEAYYATGAWSNNCNDIGGDGIIHNGCRLIYEWAFASFLCFVNAVLYAISAGLAHRERHYE
ncbi:membrane-associating domain-containing protein [Ditylenchus destructor]|nr:membrane-associating domain-containing protein [Ditylenchus destructor]